MFETTLLHIIEVMGVILLFPISLLILLGLLTMLVYVWKYLIQWFKNDFPVSV